MKLVSTIISMAIFFGLSIGIYMLGSIVFQDSSCNTPVGWDEGISDESVSKRTNELFTATNEFRADIGLHQLKRDDALDKLAMEHAMSMYERKSCDHEGFESRGMVAESLGYTTWAENAAECVFEADEFIGLWESSYGHMKNMTNIDMTHVGVAVYGRYGVQLFAGISGLMDILLSEQS